MAYQLIWEERGATAHVEDTVNDTELSEIVSKFHSHEQFDSVRYLLVDFLEVGTFDITTEALEEIGAMDYAAALSNPKVKVAMVSDDDAVRDMLSSYEKTAQESPWPLRYFGSIKEAREWITT